MKHTQFYGSRDDDTGEYGVIRDGDRLILVVKGQRFPFEDIDDAGFLADQLRTARLDAALYENESRTPPPGVIL